MLDEIHIEIIDTAIFVRHLGYSGSCRTSEFVFHFRSRWSRRASEKFIIEMVKDIVSDESIPVIIHEYRVLDIEEYSHPYNTSETLFNEGYRS